jgi:hypothetical protein
MTQSGRPKAVADRMIHAALHTPGATAPGWTELLGACALVVAWIIEETEMGEREKAVNAFAESVLRMCDERPVA